MKLLIFIIEVIFTYGVLGQSLQKNSAEVIVKRHPYLVSIRNPAGHFCSGSIISERFVLTAAECFRPIFNFDKEYMTVHAGLSSVENGSVHRVANIIPHEKFSYNDDLGTSRNNLALIEIKEPFVFDDNHQPIKLLNENKEMQLNKTGFISDWPLNKRDKQLLAVIDRESCDEFYNEYYSIRKSEVCATYVKNGDNSKDIGLGSSLVIDGYVVGVTAFYISQDTTVVFSNVAHYRNWINKHTQLVD